VGSSAAAIGVLIGAGLAQAALADCAPGLVELRAADGHLHRFSVEIADTEALREHGLMDRPDMDRGEGMLFTYPDPRHVYYWMKDTLIPLDLLFADDAGRVTAVKRQAQPQDLTPIDGGDGVRYVLEINGGLAAKLGLGPGSVMRGAAMDGARLAWPCP
jgi:uncharacterized protein